MDLEKKQLIVCKATKPIIVKTTNSRQFILKDEVFFIYDKIDGGFDVSVFHCKKKKLGTIFLETLHELVGIDSCEEEK